MKISCDFYLFYRIFAFASVQVPGSEFGTRSLLPSFDGLSRSILSKNSDFRTKYRTKFSMQQCNRDSTTFF
ncbi:hypothetical protein MKX01_001838 [Papaver californicum]|nr:hypothetical protein MKX01_001838 [Papaver californicum]